MDRINTAKKIFDAEIDALVKTRDILDETFAEILDNVVSCKGKIVLTGMGKPGHIARKLAATFSSLGSPAVYMHPAEAMHGDLGMLTSDDLVIAISYSGESDEVIQILPVIKLRGAKLVGITANANSSLAKVSDIVQVLPKFEEADPLGLAPTSSTTVELVYGDALAIVASMIYGYRETDFGKIHPAGALGKKLILKVATLMAKGEDIPKVQSGTILMDSIAVMSEKTLGMVCVVDNGGKLLGLITDGDLRRAVEHRSDVYSVEVDRIMTTSPIVTQPEMLAAEALKIINDRQILALPVVDSDRHLVGVIHWQQIVHAGIVL